MRLLKALTSGWIAFGVLTPVAVGQGEDPSRGIGATVGDAVPAHTIYGDIKVTSKSGEVPISVTFLVTLEQRSSGIAVGRDTVGPGGRYRFVDIPNGEYTLIIEAGERELYRESFVMVSSRSTDKQMDFEFEWDGGLVAGETSSYPRSPANQERMGKARQALADGNLKEASELLNAVVSEDPQDFEAWTELGTVEFQRQKAKEARKAYEAAIKERDGYLPAQLNLGKLLLSQKQFQEAIPPLTKAVELDPPRAESQYLLGEAYLGIKKGSQAVSYLYEAIRLDPDGMADVHLRLARLYDGAGYKDRAAAEYQQYLQKRPESPRKEELQKYITRNAKK